MVAIKHEQVEENGLDILSIGTRAAARCENMIGHSKLELATILVGGRTLKERREEMNELMKCGHSANAVASKTGKPCCASCFGLTPDAEIVVDTPDLTGRTARCAYFGSVKPNRRYANDECNYGCSRKPKCECGNVPSATGLAFFEYRPGEEQDKFYCGCRGWD